MYFNQTTEKKSLLNRITFGFLLFAALTGITFFPAFSAKAASVKYVTSRTLTLKTKASSGSKSAGHLKKGEKVTVYHIKGRWAKIKKNKKFYFVPKKYLSVKKPSSGSGNNEAGKCIVKYAKKFIGNPYRSGGTSLTKGTDCSGFTKAIYAHFGFTLPRTSSEQRHAGYKVSWGCKKPGDIICYSGHVAIYMGNNKIIHASNPRSGIKTSKYIKYSKVLAVRRILPS